MTSFAFGIGVQGAEPHASLSVYLLMLRIHKCFASVMRKPLVCAQRSARYLLIAAKNASFFSCKKSLLLYLRIRRSAWSRN